MWIRIFVLPAVIIAVLLFTASSASADTVKLKDGTTIAGIIKKVEAGNVHIRVENEDKVFDILKVESMDFTTPHLLPETANAPLGHFLRDFDAQEMVRNVQVIEAAAAEIQKKLAQIRTYWEGKQPISAEELKSWEAAKQEFSAPLRRYQEVLNDLYFHVLAKVDQYNITMKEASKVYVGVKGVRIGSALVAKELEALPLRKYVPAAWFDTIYYQGYNAGYDDAYIKITQPKTPYN
jgi:hypothetical protein